MTESAALAAYASGKISFGALRNALAESTEFRFEPNGTIQVRSLRALPRTRIHAADIARMLHRYKEGEVTLEELSTWGLVLEMLDAFEVDVGDMERETHIWEVIARLSLASTSRALDHSSVIELLQQMSAGPST